MGHFGEDQDEILIETLIAMFGITNTQSRSLVFKVLFPETLIKIYMDLRVTSNTSRQKTNCLRRRLGLKYFSGIQVALRCKSLQIFF